MRILVIGGTGFVGSPVVRRLVAMGHDVAVFHRGKTGGSGAGRADRPETSGTEANSAPPAGARHILGDRADLATYIPEFRAFGPEVVVDIVPLTEADARAVVQTFRGIARRVVAVSSMDVYLAYGRLAGSEPGPAVPVPLTEDSPLRGKLYPYRAEGGRYENYEKILVERVVMGVGDANPDGAVSGPAPAGTVLRLPMVYGPGDRQHRLYGHLKEMDAGAPVIRLQDGLAAWRWSRGYVDNVALAIALAAVDDRASDRIYNVAEPDALTMEEWVRLVGAAAGWSGSVIAVARDELPEDERTSMFTAQDLAADTTAIRRELGYAEDVPRDEALRLTVAWERDNPPKDRTS